MLKYQLNKQVFDNDVVNINYSDYTISNFINTYSNTILVGLTCNDVSFINNNDVLTIVSTFSYRNQETGTIDNVGDVSTNMVYAVNRLSNMIYFVDNKYKQLNVNGIYAEVSNGVITWLFDFEDTHYFTETEIPEIYINYGAGKYVYLHTNTTCVDCHQISWGYDSTTENAVELSNILFGQIDTTVDDIIEGDMGLVTVTRSQVKWDVQYNQETGKWDSRYNQELPTVSVSKLKVNINQINFH